MADDVTRDLNPTAEADSPTVDFDDELEMDTAVPTIDFGDELDGDTQPLHPKSKPNQLDPDATQPLNRDTD